MKTGKEAAEGQLEALKGELAGKAAALEGLEGEAAKAAGESQQRMAELMDDPGELDNILAKGAARASEVAAATRERVYERVGLLAAQR